MPRMEFDDTLKSDETAQVIFRGFEKLSTKKRQELSNFVNYLLQQEESKKK